MMVIPAGSVDIKPFSGDEGKDLMNLILHPMMKETIKLDKIPMSPNTLAKGGDIPVIATEDNDQNPAITTDGGSNVLIMGEYVKGVLDVDLGLRYSPNGGEMWYPEEAILTFPIEETIESQPRIDYTGGTDFQAYGVIFQIRQASCISSIFQISQIQMLCGTMMKGGQYGL